MSRIFRWPARERPQRASRSGTLLLLIGLGVLYWMTASRSIQGGDSGEFLTIALEGGIAHPPGYPLYVLLAQLAAHLPLINPALSVSLLSALCGLATILVLYAALTRWGFSDHGSFLAVCVFAVSPLFWRYTGVPEVFTLNTLLAAALLWIAGRRAGPAGIPRAGLLGLAFGLGLANHHTIVLLAPIVLLGLLRAMRERSGTGLIVVPGFAVGLCLGLTPYLTLLGDAPVTGWSWGESFDLTAVLDHFLRRDYGTLSLGITNENPAFAEQHAAYTLHVLRAFTLFTPFVLLGLLGAVSTSRNLLRRPMHRSAMDAAALLASFVLCMVFFALMNLRPQGLSASIVARFYLLPDLLLTVFLAVGFEVALRARPAVRPFVRPFTAGAISILSVANVNEATWADDYAVEDYVLNALESVPPRSVIVGTGELVFAYLAAHEAYAHRTDVTYIDLNLIRHRWYHERIRRELPDFDVPFDAESTRVHQIITSLIPRHPIFVTDVPELPGFFEGEAFYSYPLGPLLAVVPRGGPMPPPRRVLDVNRDHLGAMRFRGQRPSDPDSWGALAYQYYRRTWLALAGALEASGDPGAAAEARDTASRFEVP